MPKSLSTKIAKINEITLYAMAEESNSLIIKNFAEASIEIFEADFGFAFGKFNTNDQYKLIYKSLSTPYVPALPFKKKNHHLISINYGDHAYGNIILGFKKDRSFTDEERELSKTLGSIVAQAVTTNWLVESEQKARGLAEKQKETEVLLSQEKLKNEFIANATHELRTPLAIIKGNIDLALHTKIDSKNFIKDICVAIDEEIKRLSDIISDLALLTSQGGRGQTDAIIYGQVNLKALIDTVVKRCRTLAVDKNISITTKNIPNIKISGHEAYLEKMLTNLVKNSITYGNKNGHTVISTKVSKGFIEINVEDDGIGVSKEDINHVFERFYRGDKSHNSEGNRTGLGLAIVKWVAETHGGSVGVKSSPNHKGSIFTVTVAIKGK